MKAPKSIEVVETTLGWKWYIINTRNFRQDLDENLYPSLEEALEEADFQFGSTAPIHITSLIQARVLYETSNEGSREEYL